MDHQSLGMSVLATKLTAGELTSALPDAPVVPHGPPRSPRLPRTRRVTAEVLMRAAHRLAPA